VMIVLFVASGFFLQGWLLAAHTSKRSSCRKPHR
jgi:hypothetical protein